MGPRAHVERQGRRGAALGDAIPLQFADVGDDGAPEEGGVVTSQNGCGR